MPACTTWLLLIPLTAGAPPADDLAGRVDAVVAALWQHEKVAPTSPVDDAAFLRRVTLDLAGRVPSTEEVNTFLADRTADRRARLVERLLASPEFAEHWGRIWTEWLTGNRPVAQGNYDGRVLHAWLRDALREGKSYRQVVRELITGEGVSDRSGPANFLLRYEGKPVNLAGAVGKQFLGISLQCAQCHNHPYAQWKQPDFWGVAGFFGRLRVFDSGGENGQEGLRAVAEGRRGELQVPDLKAKPKEDGTRPMKVIAPRIPGGKELAKGVPRRKALADWVTSDENLYFARHAVNRVWGQLLGSRLEANLDFLEEDDQSQPRLQMLELLARDFTAHDYDLRRLLRVVVLSRPYGLGSGDAPQGSPASLEQREEQLRQFARFTTRPLSPDQLLASIAQATGYQGEQPEQQPDTDALLDREGDPSVDQLGERAKTLQRSLALMNGEYVQKAVQACAAVLLPEKKRPGANNIDHLFLATLARRPTAEEKTALLELAQSAGGGEGLEDVIWSLLNSAEFNTNH